MILTKWFCQRQKGYYNEGIYWLWVGNVQSLEFALNRLVWMGFYSEKEIIMNSDKVIFPGVGEASTAMKLKSTGLDKVIPNLKQPLGICLVCKFVIFRRREILRS